MKEWVVYSEKEGWPRVFLSEHRSEAAAKRVMRKSQRLYDAHPMQICVDAKQWQWEPARVTFGVFHNW
jgi:hypothetical protein